MALQVWLPLNKDYSNVGVGGHLSASTLGTVSIANDGPIGGCLVAGTEAQTTNGLSLGSNMISELGRHFSCAVWVKPNGNHVHYNGTIISSGNWNTTNGRWAFGVSQDNTKVDVFGPNYNQWVTCSVPVGKWTHLASVFNDGVGTLYKNGELVGTYNFGSAVFSSDTTTFTVGRETYAGGYFSFNGRISDLRIYDHCLSAKEVKEVSRALASHYKLDDILSISTTNLIQDYDTSFESYNNGAVTMFSNQLNSGTIEVVSDIQGHSKCLHVHSNGGNNRCYKYYGNTTADTYVVSVDYYNQSADYMPPLRVELNGGGYSWNGITQNNLLIDYGKWKRYYMTMTITATTTVYLFFMCSNGQDAYFDNVQMEKGSYPTDYTKTTRAAGKVYDCSGYGNDGTITGNITLASQSPRYDACTNLVNSYFSATMLKLSETTISFWICRNSLTGTRQFIYTGWYGISIELTAGNGWQVYYTYNSGGSTVSCSPTTTLQANTWYHCVLVIGSAGVKFYINGALEKTATYQAPYYNTSTVSVGNYGSYNNFNAKLSDFRIYGTALSAEDVAELYHTAASIDNHGNFFCGELKEL